MDATALNKALERWRRLARGSGATKDIAQSLVDELEAAGIALVPVNPSESADTAKSLLLRRADRLERDGDSLAGLKLRLQAIGG